MANINKQITLTTRENSAGPYFDVYYSTDCNNFTICVDGTNVYLPSVSSTAIVTVPDTTICIKLVNKNANCNNSFYVDAFGTTTTTSTTTIAPTTTTTTAGTTTTTTLNTQCYEYTYTAIAGCTIFYVDCNGVEQSQFVSAGQTVNLGCIRSYGQSGCGPFTQGSTCGTTTTTTTTLSCYSCGNGTQVFTTGALGYGTYPQREVCSTSNECGTFFYNAIDRPNRFNLYDSTGLISSSGWVGYATWTGPWGASLNVSPSGQFNYDFNSTSGRYVLVEYGPSDPELATSDTAEWSLSCGSCGPTIDQYYVLAPSATIQYTNQYNQTKQIEFTTNFNNNATICAVSGSITALTGSIDTLTYIGACPGNNSQRIYTTNNASSKWYGFESSSGDWVQLFASAPASFDITNCIVSGSVRISSTNIATSNLGACVTTTTTTTAAPLPQYNNCGRGNSVAEACSDAVSNARTFYSDCNSSIFGVGCNVYINTTPTALTGYTNIFMNGACWDINSSTGVITAFSSVQC